MARRKHKKRGMKVLRFLHSWLVMYGGRVLLLMRGRTMIWLFLHGATIYQNRITLEVRWLRRSYQAHYFRLLWVLTRYYIFHGV